MVLAGYLVLVLAGFDLFYVLKKMVVRGDAAATAANILARQPVFLAGFAVALLGVAAYLVVTAFLYRLFEPVERTLSLTAALFSLTGCVIQAVALTLHLVPLVVLGDQAYLSAIPLAERQALALMSMITYAKAYNISLVFFAFYLLQLGYLTIRSTFLPRWLGMLVFLAAGWLVFLYPPLASALFQYVAASSIGEVLLVLWLGVKGVDEKRWHEQAAAAGLPAYRASEVAV
jgi:hypothetical protein